MVTARSSQDAAQQATLGNAGRPTSGTSGTAPPDFAALDSPAPKLIPTANAAKELKVLSGRERVQNEVHCIAIWALRAGAALLLLLVVVRIWHLIAWPGAQWLGAEQLSSLDKMLFSSAFGGVILGYLRDVMQVNSKS